MDCKRAYFYLNVRGRLGEGLPPETASDLNGHLADCPACAQYARARNAEDEVLARAMAAVAVPSGLRARLHSLHGDRLRARSRRRVLSVALAAASVLLAVGIGAGYNSAARPRLDLVAWLEPADSQLQNPDVAVRQWLAEQDLPTELPLALDPALVVARGRERLQGLDVPFLAFHDPRTRESAKVYFCRDEQFSGLQALQVVQTSGFTATPLRDDRAYPGLTFVVVHTGRDLKPFLRVRSNA